jgi:hypothetical protein
MNTRVKTFLLEPTGKIRRYMRRYCTGSECGEIGGHGYHQARVLIDEVPENTDPIADSVDEGHAGPFALDDPRWPTVCGCGYRFLDTDRKQYFPEDVYRRADTGEELILRDATPGAMWYNKHYSKYPSMCGPDARALSVKLPNGRDWHIDGQCSNCTMPNDLTHKCWIRHGVPPEVTVDKNGHTCQAGAGSILAGDYHGFLRGGYLESC